MSSFTHKMINPNEMTLVKKKLKNECKTRAVIQRRLSGTTPRQGLKHDGRLANIPILPCDGAAALVSEKGKKRGGTFNVAAISPTGLGVMKSP